MLKMDYDTTKLNSPLIQRKRFFHRKQLLRPAAGIRTLKSQPIL